MMSKAVTLFLVVTATVSGRIIQTPRSHPHEMLLMPTFSSGWGLPHPAPVAEPCEPAFLPEVPMKIPAVPIMPTLPEIAPEPCLDELIIPQVPKAVPHPPALSAFVMPQLPRVEVPIPIPEPCLEDNHIPAVPGYVSPALPLFPPVFAPEMHAAKVSVAPTLPPMEMPVLSEIAMQAEPCLDEVVIPEIPYQPLVVPKAPELPTFVMPEMPVRIETPIAEPCLDDQPIPIAPIPEYIPSAPLPLPVVPQAPELPAFIMPELPIRIVTPIAEPCLDEQPISIAPIPEYIPPVPMPVPALPQAPELPVFVMPEMPVRIETPVVEPCLDDQPVPVAPIPEYIPPAPMPLPVLPQAPELPAFIMPEFPVKVEAAMPEPCLEDLPIPAPIPEYIPLPAPLPLPAAEPCEPAFVPEKPVFVPMAPALPALPIKEPIIAPCPEDLPAISIPQYIQPIALPAGPEAPLPHPVRVEVQQAVNKLEDPCDIGEVALVVPQQPYLPKPIAMPMMPYPGLVAADPCEPDTVKTAELPPYFVRGPSHKPILPMPIGFYNHLPVMGALQHVRHF